MLHRLREIRAGWLTYKQIRKETKNELVRKIEAKVPRKVMLSLVFLFLAVDLALVGALASRSEEISWTVSDAYQTWTKSRQYAGAAQRILMEIKKGQPPFEHTGLGDLYVDPKKNWPVRLMTGSGSSWKMPGCSRRENIWRFWFRPPLWPAG